MNEQVRRFLIEGSPSTRRVILSGLVIAVPAFFLRTTNDPFNVPKLSLLIVGVAIVAVLRSAELLQGASARTLGLLAVPIGCLGAPLVISWLASPYKSWALMGMYPRAQGLIPYLIALAFGALLADAFAGRGGELALAFGWGGAVVGGYTVIQAIGLDPFDWALTGAADYATSTTGNSNFTGGFLGITLPVLLALVLADPGRRRIATRLLVVAALGWILARSQGGWAAGLAGSALVAGVHLRDRFRWAAIAGMAVAGAIAFAVVGVVVAAALLSDRVAVPTTFLVRARWWHAAIVMGSEHLLTGRGPNSFAIDGVRHRPFDDALAFGFDFPDDPHSVPLALFASLGIMGLVGFVGLIVWVARRGLANRTSFLAIGFVGSAVAYFVQASVSIDEITLRIALWMAMAGLAASSTNADPVARVRTPARKRRNVGVPLRAPTAVIALVIPLIAAIWFAGRVVLADVKVRQALTNLRGGDVGLASSEFRNVFALRDAAEYRGLYALQLQELAIRNDPDDPTKEPEVDRPLALAAHETFSSFIHDVPYVFSIVSDGRVLQAMGEIEEAVETYRQAFALDSQNPAIRIELALALDEMGEFDRAFELLRSVNDAEVVAANYGQYWGALALVAAHVGEESIAADAIQSALAIGPLDPNAEEAQRLIEE